MITNARNTLLSANPGTLPDVSGALLNYFQSMVFTTITKTVNPNFQVVETQTNVNFKGVWQPFTPQQLLMKPEGQRAWKWFTCHAEPGLPLKTDEIITYLGVQYRVQEKLDYTAYGYIEYHLREDYV